MTVVAIVFWVAAGALIYTQVGYGVVLALLSRALPHRRAVAGSLEPLPRVSVIVAAYAEEEVIAARVGNLRAQEYPADRLQIVIACDGSPDATAERARSAGADVVLELERGGKVQAQDRAVQAASGEILAFSDANVVWEPGALRALVGAFGDARVGYVCGAVSFVDGGGNNQEGVYWRYEMFLRQLESELSSVTAGNGAIYAVRRESYLSLGPDMGHDISFPFSLFKRGWRSVYCPAARATERMTPSIESEFARKRRMVACGYPTVFQGGMLSPRGYTPLYALMIFSHRLLRYLTPYLHVVAFVASLLLLSSGWVYLAGVVVQLALVLGAVIAPVVGGRPLLIARYYVLMTTSLAFGLWDWLSGVPTATWERAEGTR